MHPRRCAVVRCVSLLCLRKNKSKVFWSETKTKTNKYKTEKKKKKKKKEKEEEEEREEVSDASFFFFFFDMFFLLEKAEFSGSSR